jgi:starch-binding outer membrane protein, SusD/RagB family
MKKITLFFILLVLLSIGCSEDFLDKGPISVQTSDSFFDTEANALSALYATYNVIRGEETFGQNKWVIGSIGSDEAEGGGAPGGNDITDIQDIDRLVMSSSNAEVSEGAWFGYYTGLLRTNLIIENIANNPAHSVDFRNRITGEAFVLRALFHFELLMTFGAVPIADHVLSPDEYNGPVRQPIANVFMQVDADLDSAIARLASSIGTRIPGRVDLSSAIGLKIKSMVYESSYHDNWPDDSRFAGCRSLWSEARTLANNFIANHESYGVGLDADYAMIWRQTYETSGEKLISASSTKLPNYEGPNVSTGVIRAVSYEYGPSCNVITSVMQMPRSFTFTADTTEINRPDRQNTPDGWGFNVPTQKFVDMFDPLDPRLYHSVVFKSDSWNFWSLGNIFLGTHDSPTGYSCKKYVMDSIEFYPGGTNRHASQLDYKILRYADVLLFAAEANLNAGDAAQATAFVNQVVERARNSGITGHPLNYTRNVTMDDILLERSRELGLEGHRYFDLVRLNRTNEMSGANNYNQTIGSELTFIKGTHEFMPLPNSEIVRTGGSLIQNYGYN